MSQAYSVIFTMLDILRHICPHSAIFEQIQAYSKSWHRQTYSCILRHIQNPWLIQTYLELLKYLSSFRQQSRAIRAYSEPYLGIFRHIQYSGLFRHLMFHVQSSIFTKLHISRNVCPHWSIFQQIQAYSDIFRHIQDLGIIGSNNIKQHLLFNQVLLLNNCSNLFGTFIHFYFKGKHSKKFFRDSISIITITIIIACHPRQRATHATQSCMPPAQPMLHTQECNPRQNDTQAIDASTPPTQARHPYHPRYHATHASMLLNPPMIACHPRQHITHASTLPTLPALARIARHFSNSTNLQPL